MLKLQHLCICAAVALFAASCTGGRAASDAPSSNGRKPRLGDRMVQERQDLERPASIAVLKVAPLTTPDPSPVAPLSAGLIEQVPSVQAATNAMASLTPMAAGRVPGRSVGLRAMSFMHDALKAAPIAGEPEGGGSTNVWAIVGFVCSFFIPLLGIIFSLIALSQIKRTGEKGHGLAIAGLIISIVSMLVIISILA